MQNRRVPDVKVSVPGTGALAMPPLLSSPASRTTPFDADARYGLARFAPAAAFHVAALAVMVWSEFEAVRMALFLFTWGLVNCFWLALLRRPGLSAALSFAMLVSLVAVSRFKFAVLSMTASFIDVMVIDADTVAFLGAVFPKVRATILIVLTLGFPLAILMWKLDPVRVHRRHATLGAGACLCGAIALSVMNPIAQGEGFGDRNYVSHFMRTGVEAVAEYSSRGFLEADAAAPDRLEFGAHASCGVSGTRPHIILVHDESSFDLRALNGVKTPPGYGRHFRSFDGKARKLLVEGAGGPSWYTEYNVLAGLSSRSYGRFQFFVTRIAAGRVRRGVPEALHGCGYTTHALYPVSGGFLAARSFYKGVGFDDFMDGSEVGGGAFEPDRFYYDLGARLIARERQRGPLFLYLYLTANHFTWDHTFHPELTPPGWRPPGNANTQVDEYLRRQAMSERDYADFLARLARDFPGEPFLIVRYGDHQPDFAAVMVDPSVDFGELTRRLIRYDLRYFTTYYAIDAVNFTPVRLAAALDPLDAPYLPLVMQEAAGLPLDPSFAEQRTILERCKGLFYGCANGAEARRFNRLLIEAGLIQGL
jgi:Sulfatase